MAHTALDGEDTQQLKADVLGGDKGTQRASELHPDDFRHIDVVRAAAHGHGHVHTAGTEGQHPDAASGGGVAVGANQGLSGNAEALQMDLMTDAVAGTGEPDAVLCGNGLNIAVVIGVFKAGLQCVVVHVGDRPLCPHPVNSHGLKFQIGHGTGGVLRQCLVDSQSHLGARLRAAAHKMRFDELLRQALSHISFPPSA